jgi:predicted AlkP superfamily phosphohydrolase/phosphomutase
MVYEKDKIRRLIEYKDKITNTQIKNDLEWIVASYNEYFVNSKDYEMQNKQYKSILNKYYNAEDEKASLKEELVLFKRKYKTLKQSCENFKSMI